MKSLSRTWLRIPTAIAILEDNLFLFQNNKKINLSSTSLNQYQLLSNQMYKDITAIVLILMLNTTILKNFSFLQL